jgi:hypothetical protein
MVRRRSGETLKQYLTTRLFDKIGIDADNFFMACCRMEPSWRRRFFATTEDNLRLMLLYHTAASGRRANSLE